jgi:hypothetical protein
MIRTVPHDKAALIRAGTTNRTAVIWVRTADNQLGLQAHDAGST